jgi:hypothetical protein
MVNATLVTLGLVPLTLMDALAVTGPLTILPELGAVKQTVTVYAPDAGELVAQGFGGLGVAETAGVGVGVLVGVAVMVGVGFGVLFPLAYRIEVVVNENAILNNARINTMDMYIDIRFLFMTILPRTFDLAKSLIPSKTLPGDSGIPGLPS